MDDGERMTTEMENRDDTTDDDGDYAADPAVAMSNVQYPTSAGITFAVRDDEDALQVMVHAARYRSDVIDDEEIWRREALELESHELDVSSTDESRTELTDGLTLYCKVREVIDGARSVTVVLMNKLTAEPGRKDGNSFFQVGFEVSQTDGAPFRARPEKLDVTDEDLESNRLLYRAHREFAIGHGCSATWEVSEGDPDSAVSVATAFLPAHQIRLMESNPDIPDDRLGFDRIAYSTAGDLTADLEAFVGGYRTWIVELKARAQALDSKFEKAAQAHVEDCEKAAERIAAGIHVLRDDALARKAFQLANRAMADQMGQVANDRAREDFRWRPFQLAFILLAIPSIVDPSREDRHWAELLWFPTGGGKTEAYLGLFAFTVFHRRLSGNSSGGVTALMRYTLRLLTTQQFERASRVVMACERLRREEEDALGEEPISIGLFVGAAATPNTVEAAQKALTKLGAHNEVLTENPCQLLSCPWCSTPLGRKNYMIHTDPDRMQIACRNEDCPFEKELPVYVVDEDLYRVRPTLVIGTVDKFAALPWRPKVGRLFNVDTDDLPPDLIIQDELHLISGPLGTMTGLYETAIDALCSENARSPKVVASTATIRRAGHQARGLFARQVRQFPPPGIDPSDSWFATEAPPERVGTRQYVGLMASGVSHASLMIRTYASLMNEANQHGRDAAVDPYWTLIGYFNSLRVLGAARMQVQDDVQDWLDVMARGGSVRRLREPIELTSRASSTDIPEYLERMQLQLPDPETLDSVLATNMISVGVDVDRLGLMVVMGQPQAAAEYIQATSRVGRRHPGLVVSVLNAARSRDRSHFEGFLGFHRALYKSVEASSVTPFSPRARDRALAGLLVAIVRQRVHGLRDNAAAAQIGAFESDVQAVRDLIIDRAREVDPGEASGTATDLDLIIDKWRALAEANEGLLYEAPTRNKASLLVAASPEQEPPDSYPTMWSLRDVDAESTLYPRPSS